MVGQSSVPKDNPLLDTAMISRRRFWRISNELKPVLNITTPRMCLPWSTRTRSLGIQQRLNPPAPELRRGEIQKEYNDAELYWIIKNEIRMTGMPAFGPTHEEKDLWAIVAFTRRLPEMQAEDYRVCHQNGRAKAAVGQTSLSDRKSDTSTVS